MLFVVVLKKAAWKPLIEGLDRREAKIRQDIAGSAEQARIKAEEMLAEHSKKRLDAVQDEIREILADGTPRCRTHTPAGELGGDCQGNGAEAVEVASDLMKSSEFAIRRWKNCLNT